MVEVTCAFTARVVPRERCSAGALLGFSLYDNEVVTEEQIQKWADEAEAGYDVDELKRRGRGRPGRGAAPMQVVAVRLTADELEALDAAAAKNDMSRSEAIRAALAHFAA
jgi:predicted transcriptional regulator